MIRFAMCVAGLALFVITAVGASDDVVYPGDMSAEVQSALRKEEADLRADLDDISVYPVVSLCVGHRF